MIFLINGEEYILWNVCINSSKRDILKFKTTFIEAQGPCNNKIKFDPYGTVWNRHVFLIGLWYVYRCLFMVSMEIQVFQAAACARTDGSDTTTCATCLLRTWRLVGTKPWWECLEINLQNVTLFEINIWYIKYIFKNYCLRNIKFSFQLSNFVKLKTPD